jgi:hypothetical protein
MLIFEKQLRMSNLAIISTNQLEKLSPIIKWYPVGLQHFEMVLRIFFLHILIVF